MSIWTDGLTVSRKQWDKYITLVRAINDKAAYELELWMQHRDSIGMDFLDYDTNGMNIFDAAYYIAEKYSNASAAVAVQLCEAMAEATGVPMLEAELAENPSYNEIAKTVQGVMNTSRNRAEISSAVGRLVKRTGARTVRRNAARNGAQYAWVPSGDTCAWCIMLAGKGWQYERNSDHKEHIHSNCDCNYAIRFDNKTQIAGYDPEAYADQYREADGSTRDEKLNSMRRKYYAEHKEEILAQKADAYAKRQELNSSQAVETDIN